MADKPRYTVNGFMYKADRDKFPSWPVQIEPGQSADDIDPPAESNREADNNGIPLKKKG